MISIIIPLYNREKIFYKTLNSILNQTCKDYEVVVIDDGSSDSSFNEAKKYENKFWKRKIRYKVLRQKNSGAPKARNVGFEHSRGEYLLFCDADAVLKPNALRIMLEALEKNKKAGYADPWHRDGWKLFKLFAFDTEKLKKMPYIHTMALIRREHFPKKGWDESIKKLQDWDLFLTMLEEGHVGVWIPKVLFKIHTGGVYSTWMPRIFYELFPSSKKVKKYNEAVEIIKKKHNLS